MTKGSPTKLPSFLLKKVSSRVEEINATVALATAEPNERRISNYSSESNISVNESAETRCRSDSLDKLAATATALGEIESMTSTGRYWTCRPCLSKLALAQQRALLLMVDAEPIVVAPLYLTSRASQLVAWCTPCHLKERV